MFFYDVRPVFCELERCMWVMLLACFQLLKGVPASGIQTAFVILKITRFTVCIQRNILLFIWLHFPGKLQPVEKNVSLMVNILSYWCH